MANITKTTPGWPSKNPGQKSGGGRDKNPPKTKPASPPKKAK